MVGIAAGRGACPAQHEHSSARCCAHVHKYHGAPVHKVVSTPTKSLPKEVEPVILLDIGYITSYPHREYDVLKQCVQ